MGDLPKAVVPSPIIQRLWDELAHHSLTPLKYGNSLMEERVDVRCGQPNKGWGFHGKLMYLLSYNFALQRFVYDRKGLVYIKIPIYMHMD